jgi:hypothetical protein
MASLFNSQQNNRVRSRWLLSARAKTKKKQIGKAKYKGWVKRKRTAWEKKHK